MKVTCESCGAVYRIPDAKLTKEVSRATCKKCGNKIVIRKPQPAVSTLSHSYHFDDDDDAMDHDERTVIASVPELQRFDATPPLSVPGVPEAAAPLPEPPDDEDEDEDESVQTTVAAPPPKASAPPPPPPPPKAEAPLAAATPTPPAASLLKGVPMPGQASKLVVGVAPLVVVALGILGTFFFLHNRMWSSSPLTAAGFALALYGQVAALMALVDIRSHRSPRAAMVFGLPAAVCVLLFVILLAVQKKENMAFLNVKTMAVASAVDGPDDELFEYVYEEVVDEETGLTTTKKVRRPKRPGSRAVKATSPGGQTAATLPANNTAEAAAKTTTNGLMASDRDRTTSGPSAVYAEKRAELTRTRLNQGAVAKKVSEDEGVKRCLRRHSDGVSGVLIYEMLIEPQGGLKDAHFDKSSTLYRSELEKCLNDQVARLTFPTFSGEKPERMKHKFVF